MLRKMLANVAAAAASDDERGARIRCWQRATEKRILLVLVTGDQGLGRRVQRQPDQSARSASSTSTAARTSQLELIGRKGRDFFRKRGADDHRRARRHCSPSRDVRRRRGDRAEGRSSASATTRSTRSTWSYNEFKSVMAQKLTGHRACCRSKCREQAARDRLHLRAAAGGTAGSAAAALRGDASSTARCSNRPPPNMPRA